MSNEIFYKYITPSTAKHIFGHVDDEGKDVLGNLSLKIDTPQSFNDPFDCCIPKLDIKINIYDMFIKSVGKAFDIPKEHQNEIFRQGKLKTNKEFFQVVNSGLNDVRDGWDELTMQYRVLCLTVKNNNILMWSHYAKNHEGLVLGFNFKGDKKYDGIKKVDYSLKQAEKMERMIKIGIKTVIHHLSSHPKGFDYAFAQIDKVLDSDQLDEVVKKYILRNLEPFFFIKKNIWSYEEEYRLVKFREEYPNKLINFSIESLVEVIFGVRASEETITNTMGFLKKLGFKGKAFKACRVNGELSVKHKRLE
ncbi:TPA: DUF2971 domain-containing protein [Proteus mirabilis]|nr:DUF2971 domain-containing protein [Proteus mirabilis]HEK2691530.1 DUF2971 domain-containing protein [Proteus mirabilis]